MIQERRKLIWKRILALPMMVLCLLVCVLASDIDAAPISASDESPEVSQSASSKAPVLQGAALIREQLTPVPLTLRSGSSFNQGLLSEESGEDEWIKIPSWRAGIFERKSTSRWGEKYIGKETRTFQSKYVTPSQVLQKDRLGGIWQYLTPPENQAIDMDKYVQYSKVVENTVVKSTEEEEVMQAKFVSLKVDKATGKIVEVFQQVQIDYLAPLVDGKGYRQKSYVMWFDESGNRRNKSVEEMSSDLLSIRPLDTVDVFQGKDMRASLKNFLERTNLKNLVPSE